MAWHSILVKPPPDCLKCLIIPRKLSITRTFHVSCSVSLSFLLAVTKSRANSTATVFQRLCISRLPSDWPAGHNSCNNSMCHYPNAPQCKADIYLCGGRLNGAYCTGTVKVTNAMARKALRQRQMEVERRREHDEKVRHMRREEARAAWGYKAQEQRSRGPSGMVARGNGNYVRVGRPRPLSRRNSGANIAKSGKLMRRRQDYQKGCVTLQKYGETIDE